MRGWARRTRWSLTYFTGIRWGLSERLFAVAIPREGRPFVVTPAFEEDRAREQLAAGPLAGGADVLTWHEDADPYLLVRDGLRARGRRARMMLAEFRVILPVERTIPAIVDCHSKDVVQTPPIKQEFRPIRHVYLPNRDNARPSNLA